MTLPELMALANTLSRAVKELDAQMKTMIVLLAQQKAKIDRLEQLASVLTEQQKVLTRTRVGVEARVHTLLRSNRKLLDKIGRLKAGQTISKTIRQSIIELRQLQATLSEIVEERENERDRLRVAQDVQFNNLHKKP